MKIDRDNIKLSCCGTRYFYNGRNVTCVYDFYLKMPKQIEFCTGPVYNTVVGVAKCNENDEYDQTKGEKIALARAESLAYAKANAMLVAAWSEARDVVNSPEANSIINSFTNKKVSCIDHNKKYINWVESEKTF